MPEPSGRADESILSAARSVLVQGITGREAAMVVRHMLAYGTRVVAGVTPGRGGQAIEDVPVYDTVAQAQAAHATTATLISVPPAGALDAVLEALDAGLRLLVLVTERVPRHDALRAVAAAQAAGATLIGPNCTGLIVPALRLKLGPIGGDRPERCFAPGRVAVVSRSGGMTAECAWMVRRAGEGVSIAISVGGDPLVGTPPAAALALLERDPATAAAVLWGEPGTRFEEDVADLLLAGGFTRPLIVHIAGRFVEDFPAGAVFGHAAALIAGEAGRPSAKIGRLRAAGAHIAERLDDLGAQLRAVLG
ncbi:MAG: CoA-binding protein [Chloroflexi bacterium]|nr:CoA-binding protein [Chloroflexota bacterium]